MADCVPRLARRHGICVTTQEKDGAGESVMSIVSPRLELIATTYSNRLVSTRFVPYYWGILCCTLL